MSADWDEHDDGAGRDEEWVPAYLHEDCDCPDCCDAFAEREAAPVDADEYEALLAGHIRRVEELEAERTVVHDKLLTLGTSIHHLLAERVELHSALEEMRAELDALRALTTEPLAPVYQLRPVG